MELQFTKMHGAGNDFVFIDCLKSNIENLEAVAKKLCDRRFGIGADQLLTVHPSKVADFKMEIYNADGSQVEMCGNGIRCFAKYVYDHGITRKRALEVETLAGIIRPKIVGDLVEVDMGEPILDGRKIPVDADGEIKNRPLTVRRQNLRSHLRVDGQSALRDLSRRYRLTGSAKRSARASSIIRFSPNG